LWLISYSLAFKVHRISQSHDPPSTFAGSGTTAIDLIQIDSKKRITMKTVGASVEAP
jgi:hypothetical protein